MRLRIENMLKDLEAFEANHAGTARLVALASGADLVKMSHSQTPRIVGPRAEEGGETVQEWRAKAELRLLNLQFAMAMRDALETGGGLTWAKHLH